MSHNCSCGSCNCHSKSTSKNSVSKKSKGQVNTHSPYGEKEPTKSVEYR